jgi:hypothetical protein
VQEDRLDACFEFGLAGAIIDAVNTGDPINLEEQTDVVLTSYPLLQYGTFLTNHDMDRVFSALAGNTEKMKLAATLYLTLPGVPFVYYGEEVGMTGTGDHLNIRRPMQWSDHANAGFSNVAPWQSPGGNYLTHNVEDMNADPNSLLQQYRKLIGIRNEQDALRRGQTQLVEDDAEALFSFARVQSDQAVVVVANTGTSPVDPVLWLEFSSLAPGEYFVTELQSIQSLGKITINADGGFSGAWIVLLSEQNPITAISEPADSDPLKVFPNPANGSFYIKLNEHQTGPVEIQIQNAVGQVVFQKWMYEPSMEVGTRGWTAGLYYVQMSGANGLSSEKLLIPLCN